MSSVISWISRGISFGARGQRGRPGRRSLVLGALAGVALAVAGCSAFSSSNSFSESSGSVSDSVSGSSDSASGSSDSSGSSSGDADQAYRREVRGYVAVAAARDTPPATLRRGVSEIALGFGVSDWEAAPGTRAAIEAGLQDLAAPERNRYLAALAIAPAAPHMPSTPPVGRAEAAPAP